MTDISVFGVAAKPPFNEILIFYALYHYFFLVFLNCCDVKNKFLKIKNIFV
jgi:hypothetical protein